MTLHALLRPGSLAVAGASPRSFAGQIPLRNSTALGFGGTLSVVSPRYTSVAGVPAVRSFAELERMPDTALILVRTDLVAGVIAPAIAAGVKNFIVPGGRVSSASGAQRLRSVLAGHGREHGIRVIGPDTMGVVDLVTGSAPYIGTVPPHVRRGGVGVISQSGAVVEAFINARGKVPISTAISVGAEAVTSTAELLEFFTADPETHAVCAFVEGFVDASKFLGSARAFIAAGKQLAVCLIGRTALARAGIEAHSGRLAPSAAVAAAAFEQIGAVVAVDLDELIAIGEILGSGSRPRGIRTHVVANSGGEASMIADLAHDAGLELPAMSSSAKRRLCVRWPALAVRNPLDPWGIDDYSAIFPEAIDTAGREAGDILIIAHDGQAAAGEEEKALGAALAQYGADSEAAAGKLRVVLSPSSAEVSEELAKFCRENGLVQLAGARPALAALAKLARAQARQQTALPADSAHLCLEGTASLSEADALDLLDRLAVHTPRRRVVLTPSEAVVAAETLGWPVVLKGVAPLLWHKTDLGLVRVGLTRTDDVFSAATDILEAGNRAGHKCALLVSEFVHGELELFVGFKRDPHFGPVNLLGLGGVWAEALGLVSVHTGALDRAAAATFLAASRVGDLLAQSRGLSFDVDAIITAMLAVSGIGNANPSVSAIDINPLIARRDTAVAVDATIQRTSETDAREQ